VINLTQVIDADRNGQVYEEGVMRDEPTDAAVEAPPIAARRWLLDQPACRQ
jgi:hypothetical protein